MLIGIVEGTTVSHSITLQPSFTIHMHTDVRIPNAPKDAIFIHSMRSAFYFVLPGKRKRTVTKKPATNTHPIL